VLKAEKPLTVRHCLPDEKAFFFSVFLLKNDSFSFLTSILQ